MTYHLESINGHKVEKRHPQRAHAVIQSFLIQWFGRVLAGKNLDVMPEANVICEPDRLIPDVAIAPSNAHYVDGTSADPPILAVEILSPGQTLADVIDKCNRLLRAGTQQCWMIWPGERRAWNYSPLALQEAALGSPCSNLQFVFTEEGSDSIFKFLPVDALWAELDQRGL